MSFRSGAAYAKAMAETRPCIAVVTGGRSGIGLAMAQKIATWPFVETVLAVSRSITMTDILAASDIESTSDWKKIQPLAADITTAEGRKTVVDCVYMLCSDPEKKQLRYLIHSAGTIYPIKSMLEVTPSEFSHAMKVNCEAPLFLTTSLYRHMTPIIGDNEGVAGRVLHVSSGAAHGAPPTGWGCYGITKAAFFQSYRVLEKEFRESRGGQVVVGSFRPGVVDTSMQGTIREAPPDAMPAVDKFQTLKANVGQLDSYDASKARPPPTGALDTPDNVAYFAEYLLLGTTDEEFANKDDPNGEYDIRNQDLFSKWIDDHA